MSKVLPHSLFTEYDIYLFKSGSHFELYTKMGSHPMELEGQWGTYFSVWAPNAKQVSVVGNFNQWNTKSHPLFARWDHSGIWEGFIPGVGHGELYKYLVTASTGNEVAKIDPFARFFEIPPNTASIIWKQDYEWKDTTWMNERANQPTDKKNENADRGGAKPFSVYEVHIGSWRKNAAGTESLSYQELATELVQYVQEMGFTHVEFLPVKEHPYFPSWGYQITGYFAPTSRFGLPEDFKALVDAFHQAGIGVIMDWVPSHFPTDAHGLAQYDGTHLFEHEDPRQGFHPDWKSSIFNFGRNEVQNFLISNALFWCREYHIDGLRVDAVASMLYLDYSRQEGEWVPNRYGGKENLEAIAFLKRMNEAVYKEIPGVVTIAEESTAWSGVSRPVSKGGLGFGQKWMMGWMHDTLNYFGKEPIHRKYHHNQITFSVIYAFSENFMLPLSHDEVVHGKGSLIGRMPGDEWQRFANLRLLFGYMFTHPGTKLLFMGGEFGQTSEWSLEKGLAWDLLKYPIHKGIQEWVKTLNGFYKNTPALYEKQFSHEGFEWINHGDHAKSYLAYYRKGNDTQNDLLVICNFTPATHTRFRTGVPIAGEWEEVLNSDDKTFGGSGISNAGKAIVAEEKPWDDRPYSIEYDMPPLATLVFARKS